MPFTNLFLLKSITEWRYGDPVQMHHWNVMERDQLLWSDVDV